MPGVLERALAKIAGREAAFVADRAGKRHRDAVCKDFRLSYEEHDVLAGHFAAQIATFRADVISGIDRSLPAGDRE